jgi:hypothetical protein
MHAFSHLLPDIKATRASARLNGFDDLMFCGWMFRPLPAPDH